MRLTIAITILGATDPVRVFEDFATLDLVSNGRAEIIAGRGAYAEAFSLFGLDLVQYDELFAEKLDLLLKLRVGEPVHWRGRHRPSLNGRIHLPASATTPFAGVDWSNRNAEFFRTSRLPGVAAGTWRDRR
ncbi:LLM class flavin-dependent oxidoreductase [Mesorhizobium sp. DCY119]|uniref:LLM class flavin-dependent oxidoreductase n=1 Tax=Mesorhizobium sp. DCY119 TaxID=2108445 RepID=UPI001FE05CE6|nr:LLM class flavin-dependent oxidoreductase [Mesorhizobium sp. DCY119]